ncbi:DUF1758 domain-containing protein [Trichonephila clavipes]|nr:DUF1758 domain-containing protein [Trichonephila clavipes]
MEFEQRYFDLKLKFQDKIHAIDASRWINVSGQNISIAIPTEQSNANFRLPKLNVPVFTVKFEDWINFKDLFVTAVHSETSLSNIQKFQYLKDQKGISQVNMTDLRNLVDTSDEVLKGLKALGTEATNRDPWLIQILMQKLDTETKRLWSVKTAEKDFPTLKEFVEFLNVRCSSLELMTCNDSDTKFLPTAKVLLYNNEGGSFLFRALLDSGSESSFISENAINILGLKRCKDGLSLSGISGIQAGTTRGSVGLKIGSRFCKDQLTIKAYILNKVTSQIPVERINIKELDYLEGIPLADEDFSKPSECDVILGSDCFFSILRNGRITGSKGQPIAQSTIFGWVVAGKIQGNCKSFMQSHLIRVENECNDSILQQFWQTEELPLKKISLSEEEEFCENHFKATYKINNEELEREYKNFMEEYEKLGHMSPNKELDGRISYFLPHHAVRRKDSITTKLRVVFDGSCKPPNSNSLNPVLGVGQILQPDIFTLILWLLKLNWDEALPEHFVLKWKKFQMEFQQVCHLSIPRWLQITHTDKKVTLHGFSDASKAAYACVVYAVQRNRETTEVVMVGGKSKVAPLKPICIPRLELNGVLL